MNKSKKVLISILGATNLVFSIFIPIALSLVCISFFSLTGWKGFVLLLSGILSSIYRSIEVVI